MIPTIRDKSKLEDIVIRYLINKGVTVEGYGHISGLDPNQRDLPVDGQLRFFYQHLSPEDKEDLDAVCSHIVTNYPEIQRKYPLFTDEIFYSFLDDVDREIYLNRISLEAAVPALYHYVKEQTHSSNEKLHNLMIILLGVAGRKAISREQWEKLYQEQPDYYKTQVLYTIANHVDPTLAEELLPDLKERIGSKELLKVYLIIKCLHRDKPAQFLGEELLKYAPKEEWMKSDILTDKAKQEYFDG